MFSEASLRELTPKSGGKIHPTLKPSSSPTFMSKVSQKKMIDLQQSKIL